MRGPAYDELLAPLSPPYVFCPARGLVVTAVPANGLSGAGALVPVPLVVFLGEEVTLPVPLPLGPYTVFPATAEPLLVFGFGADVVPG